MRSKKARIARLTLAVVALFSIGMGFLKVYSHYNSIFRSEPLDYIVAIGAIVGGLLVLTQKNSKWTSVICLPFLVLEAVKAIMDFFDFHDVLLCVIASICLITPIIRYSIKH